MKGEARNPGPLRYRPPALADWTVRERLALATAVVNCPDKNWATISRTVKRFASEERDEDYFAPRHCARQYSDLMEKMEQPKRRGEAAQYDCSPEELLVKMLTLDRIEELQAEVKRTQELYCKTKTELADIETGRMDKRQMARLYADLKEKEKEEAPEEELIRVSEEDLARIQAPASPPADPPKDPVLQHEVIHSADLGVPKDEDYEEETRRMDEARQNVVRSLAAPEVKEEVEEVEEDDAETEEAEAEADEARVEVKEEEEDASDPEQANADEPPPASPASSSSSSASTPRRRSMHRPSLDLEDDDDDDATEGDEDESGGQTSQRNDKAYRTWKKSIHMIIRAAQSHKHASVFLSPVTDDIANGYSQVVFRPMDLSTIKRRVDSGELRRTADFQRDVMLMFTNAVMYNNAEHDVHKMALEMYEDVMSHIEQYLSTQVMSPSVESKVLRRRQSDQHEEEAPVGRRRRGSADSKDDPPKKSRK